MMNHATDDESEPLLASTSGDEVVVHRRSRNVPGSRDLLPPSIQSYYNITEIIEMGRMASLFFNRFGISILNTFCSVSNFI